MAKRAPVNEKPYNPVEEALVRAVWLGENAADTSGAAGEETRRQEEGASLPVPAIEETTGAPNIVALPRSDKAHQAQTHAFARGKQAREKRVLLTHTEERQIELLIHRLALELETPVKLSHVLRACVALLQHAEHEIVALARREAPLTRPPNGSHTALVEFEHRLAQLLLEALRTAPSLH